MWTVVDFSMRRSRARLSYFVSHVVQFYECMPDVGIRTCMYACGRLSRCPWQRFVARLPADAVESSDGSQHTMQGADSTWWVHDLIR